MRALFSGKTAATMAGATIMGASTGLPLPGSRRAAIFYWFGCVCRGIEA
jgi:hypothetical protein